MSNSLRRVTAVFILYLEKGSDVSTEVVAKAREAASKVLEGLPTWMELVANYDLVYEAMMEDNPECDFVRSADRYYLALGTAALTIAGAEPRDIMGSGLQVGMYLAWVSKSEEVPFNAASESDPFGASGCFAFSGTVKDVFEAAERGEFDA